MDHTIIQTTSTSEEQTLDLGRRLAGLLQPGDIVALDGELGAGKTRLVRGIASGLGIDPGRVSSPTFVIMHEHDAPAAATGAPGLVHVDAYRLTSPEELETIGWDRVTSAAGQVAGIAPIVVIEWASRLGPLLDSLGPERLLHVNIEHAGEHERDFTLRVHPAWQSRPGLTRFLTRTRLPAGWTRCPITGKPVSPHCPTFPFFDEHARLADLGRWFSGGYSISRELVEEDFADPDLGPPPGPSHGL